MNIEDWYFENDNGEPHRVNGPARNWNGEVWFWALNGKGHRYYGPQNNGGTWWLHGKRIK